ncbi:MAG TPA: hypothetical protein VE779_00955 [Candidatus Angelobacter sp.]|nr:hypothetical protein [Candidatus Angelobacter sp.]
MNQALRGLVWLAFVLGAVLAGAQSNSDKAAATDKPAAAMASALEHQIFDILRNGDTLKFLSFVPEDGVNLGHDAQHTSRDAVVEQFTQRTGLYCKLFDSACLSGTPHACSYRELLTQSEKVRTASTEATRNGVRQAIVVAQVENQKCGGAALIDFIFNHQKGGWKLFSIP